MAIVVPAALRELGRWQHEGAAGRRWIENLPLLVERYLARWDLVVDGDPMHGYHSLAVPVRRGDQPFVLKVTWSDRHLAEQVLALRLWRGMRVVRLVDADLDGGVLLLDRLDHTRSLRGVPLAEAVPVAGELLRELAIAPPPDLRRTSGIAAEQHAGLGAQWERLGRPFARPVLDTALGLAADLSTDADDLLVNSDLHYDQVLRDKHGIWTVVDPAIVAGVLEYQVAPLVWTRFDELGEDRVGWCVDALVESAALDPERARAWALLRTVEYWLWGLDAGLTEDPVRCGRIAAVLMAERERR